MITVSMAYKKELSAICIVDKGIVQDFVCLSNLANYRLEERELHIVLLALKHLKQYMNNNQIVDTVYFESNEGSFCKKWLIPNYSLDIPTELLPLFDEVTIVKESLPMKYNFAINKNPFAMQYLDKKYIATVSMNGISDITINKD